MPDIHIGDNLFAWLLDGERGVSSNYLVWVLTGLPAVAHRPAPGEAPHPVDAGDFRRCRLLLEQCPELAGRLVFVANESPQWRALVAAWGELCATMDAECADWREEWRDSWSKTDAAIDAVLSSAMKPAAPPTEQEQAERVVEEYVLAIRDAMLEAKVGSTFVEVEDDYDTDERRERTSGPEDKLVGTRYLISVRADARLVVRVPPVPVGYRLVSLLDRHTYMLGPGIDRNDPPRIFKQAMDDEDFKAKAVAAVLDPAVNNAHRFKTMAGYTSLTPVPTIEIRSASIRHDGVYLCVALGCTRE